MYLGRKYAQVFLLEQYLFLEVHSCSTNILAYNPSNVFARGRLI